MTVIVMGDANVDMEILLPPDGEYHVHANPTLGCSAGGRQPTRQQRWLASELIVLSSARLGLTVSDAKL